MASTWIKYLGLREECLAEEVTLLWVADLRLNLGLFYSILSSIKRGSSPSTRCYQRPSEGVRRSVAFRPSGHGKSLLPHCLSSANNCLQTIRGLGLWNNLSLHFLLPPTVWFLNTQTLHRGKEIQQTIPHHRTIEIKLAHQTRKGRGLALSLLGSYVHVSW